jgi:hypothetical protein
VTHLLFYLVRAYFFTYLSIENLPLTEWTTKVKSDINSVEVHSQLSHKGHPVDGVLVGVGSLWPLGGGEQPFHGPPSVEEKFCWIRCISDAFRNASGPELSWLDK